MENTTALSQLAIIIAAGVVSAVVAAKLKLPVILGYLIGGVMVSLVFADSLKSDLIQNIAQLGAALLLFTVGVEFSIDGLRQVLRIALPGAIIQSLVVIAAGVLILPLLGFSSYDALFIGVLASTSSTVFVVKMLEGREELNTVAGRIMLGWLVLQDVLIILWFLLLQTFAPNATHAPDLLLAIFKAVIVIGVTYGVGKFVLPPVMKQIAKIGSEELLIVAVVGVIAGFAVLANLFDVSFTIGAFLAGLSLSESFLNHEIFTEIKPLRNLFTMIFFVSVGSIFDITAVVNNVGPILAILVGLLSIKVLVTIIINLFFRLHIKNALKIGFGISQIGEFAFLGAQLGLMAGWIDRTLYSILIACTIVSMSLTPLFYTNVIWFYNLLAKNIKRRFPNTYRHIFMNADEDEVSHKDLLADHVVLCGYGRVGMYVAKALQGSDIPFIVIELDMSLAEQAQKEGLSVIYGDASNQEILKDAGIETARAIVLALPGNAETEAIVNMLKQLNADIKVVVRAQSVTNLDTSMVDHLIEPEFEAAVQIITTLYRLIHRRHKRAVETVRYIKASSAPQPSNY